MQDCLESYQVRNTQDIFKPHREKTSFLHMQKNPKDADQLRGNLEADQRLCFRYTDTSIPLLSKSEISSHPLWLYSLICVGPGRKPGRLFIYHNEAHFQPIRLITSFFTPHLNVLLIRSNHF